jgi:N-acetylglucosamine-6-sulfatase
LRTVLAIGVVLFAATISYAQSPNVILIVTDDQASDSFDPVVGVPTLAALASHAVYFANAAASPAFCAPSRASLMTGDYAHTTGVWSNSQADYRAWGQQFEPGTTLAQWMHDAGYVTGFFGKYENGCTRRGDCSVNGQQPLGWDYFETFGRTYKPGSYAFYYCDIVRSDGTIVHARSLDPASYSTDLIAADAQDFIASAVTAGRPFFVYWAPFAPHSARGNIIWPAPRHVGEFAGIAPYRPPNFEPGLDMLDGAPRWMIGSVGTLNAMDNLVVDQYREQELEALLAVYEAERGFVSELRAAGQLSNTIVVWISDNGYSLGSHNWFGKTIPYSEALRVPLLFKWGALPEPLTVQSPALNIDVAPTIAMLADVTIPVRVDGQSLFRRDDEGRWQLNPRDEGSIEWTGGGGAIIGANTETIPGFVGRILTNFAHWTYTTGADTGFRERYDLVNDPYEMHNLMTNAQPVKPKDR